MPELLRTSIQFLSASLNLFIEMAPYLLFGFLIAGLLHVFVPIAFVVRHLGHSSFGAVMRSVVFGIPLPLCSCSVIPTSVMLRAKGASRAAIVSFLIATPITGADSILATFSLMGFHFAWARVLASALVAIIAGWLTLVLLGRSRTTPTGETNDSEAPTAAVEPDPIADCHNDASTATQELTAQAATAQPIWREFVDYTFGTLIGDIWKSLAIGVLIGGAIQTLIPNETIDLYLGSSFSSLVIMMAIGIPMYVCATGSIPIAAALMMKGMSPGAALVFLLCGPATNAVTVSVVAKIVGRKTAVIYLLTIGLASLGLGYLMNLHSDLFTSGLPALHLHGAAASSNWLGWLCALLLTGAAIRAEFKGRIRHTSCCD